MPIYPISFSIPESKIVKHVPNKTKLFADYKPGVSYIFSKEEEYYKGYQEAVFGYTRKKVGWDCLRHYEILANGCIPYFEDIDSMPPNTMKNFPRDLVKEAMKNATIDNYHFYIEKLLNYTRNNLDTITSAKYVLEKCGVPKAESILYLSSDPSPDYMRCLLLHGFKMLLGERCVDVVKIPHIYDSYPVEQTEKLYGKGFSYTRMIPDVYCNRENIPVRILNNEFDLIIYGSIHRGMPYRDFVKHVYKNKVAYVCGEDHPVCNCDLRGLDSADDNIFIRELRN